MIVVEKHVARLIMRDRKTQLRIPVRPNRELGIAKRCPYVAGDSYSVQFTVTLRTKETDAQLAAEWMRQPYGTWGATSQLRDLERKVKDLDRSARRRHVSVGWVQVTEVRRGLLHETTPVDVLAMGYQSRDEFFEVWRAKYNTGPLAEVPIWIVTFERTEEPSKLLARIGSGSDDYTRSPEIAVDDAGIALAGRHQRKISEEAHLHTGQMAAINQARREQYELEKRLERARADAELRGVDVSSPLRVIERQVAKIERRVYPDKAA